MQSQTNILVISDYNDATAQISFVRPFAGHKTVNTILFPVYDYIKNLGDIGFVRDLALRATQNKSFEYIIFCRATSEIAEDVLHEAIKLKKFTCCFLDDDLSNVPVSVGLNVSKHFSAPDRKKRLENIITNSSKVLCSTQALCACLTKRYSLKKCSALEVYRSVQPLEVVSPAQHVTENKVFGYMGSQSHMADLEMILSDIAWVLGNVEGAKFELFGSLDIPEALKKYSNQISLVPKAVSYASFLQKLQSLGWAVGLAPLRDIEFNNFKADTKWVEYSCANIPTIASKSKVYSRAETQGCLLTSCGDWKEKIALLLNETDSREHLIHQSKTFLSKRYTNDLHVSNLLQELGL